MALLSISAAARAVEKDRGTLHRYIKIGRLSTTFDPVTGSKGIETSELIRVFGTLKGDGATSDAATATKRVESNTETQMINATIEVLQHQLKMAQEREGRLLAMLEREQEARRNLEQRLLPLGQGDQAASQPEKPKGFWARLFGFR